MPYTPKRQRRRRTSKTIKPPIDDVSTSEDHINAPPSNTSNDLSTPTSNDLSTADDLSSNLHELQLAYQKRASENFLTYLQGLIIPSGYGPKIFSECIADFQWECFKDLAPSIHAVRDGVMPPKRRFWIERTKKASKDGDIGAAILWLVAFPKKPTYMQIGAGDRDQAAIIKSRIVNIIHYNPWLNDLVEVQTWKIVNKQGLAVIDIMAADITGAHGGIPDLLVVNELSHVTKFEFAENLLANADGVPQGVVIVATNAGYKGTKAESWRKIALESDFWTTHILHAPAPWIGKEELADSIKREPASRYARLWQGVWSSNKGDALEEDAVNAIFSHNLTPLTKPQEGFTYLGGLDLATKQDHAGCVILEVDYTNQRLRVAQMRRWKPRGRYNEVDLVRVEEEVYGLARAFNCHWFGYDPHQAVLMAQRLTRRGIPMREWGFNPANQVKMADALLQAVNERRLVSYRDSEDTLLRDLEKFTILEKNYGYRLEAVADESGHADVGTALVICLPRAMALLNLCGGFSSDDTLIPEEDTPLTESEAQSLPGALKSIYDLDPHEEDDISDEDAWKQLKAKINRWRQYR